MSNNWPCPVLESLHTKVVHHSPQPCFLTFAHAQDRKHLEKPPLSRPMQLKSMKKNATSDSEHRSWGLSSSTIRVGYTEVRYLYASQTKPGAVFIKRLMHLCHFNRSLVCSSKQSLEAQITAASGSKHHVVSPRWSVGNSSWLEL